MIVYRITLAKHAGKLVSSGNAARWNSKDVNVVYAAESRSLACLENVVHRNSFGLADNFRVVLIEIPDKIKIEEINPDDLKKLWADPENLDYTRSLGDAWVKRNTSAVLRAPSAVIKQEFNYILNTAHIDFSDKWYKGAEPFEFDNRIKR